MKSRDASIGHKAAAWDVTPAMKVRQKLGMGCVKPKRKKKEVKKSKKRCNSGGKMSFLQHILQPVLTALTEIVKDGKVSSGLNDMKNLRRSYALKLARPTVRKVDGKNSYPSFNSV